MHKEEITVTIKLATRAISEWYTCNKSFLERATFTALLSVFVYSVFSIGAILFDYYISREVHTDIRQLYNSQNLDTEESYVYISLGEKESLAYNRTYDDEVIQDCSIDVESITPVVIDTVREYQIPTIFVAEEIPSQAPANESVAEITMEPRLARKAFDKLIAVNEDIVGWIKIKNTRVDYPVLQAEDNEYYMTRNIHRERSRAGSLFMDFRNDVKMKDQNVIIYGHNMRNNTMLTDIVLYKQERFFNNNPYIHFDTLYESKKWLVFSVYVTDVNFNYLITNFRTDDKYSSFLETIISKSLFKRDVGVNITDRILTLSTCSNEFENARTVVHAKLINQ